MFLPQEAHRLQPEGFFYLVNGGTANYNRSCPPDYPTRSCHCPTAHRRAFSLPSFCNVHLIADPLRAAKPGTILCGLGGPFLFGAGMPSLVDSLLIAAAIGVIIPVIGFWLGVVRR